MKSSHRDHREHGSDLEAAQTRLLCATLGERLLNLRAATQRSQSLFLRKRLYGDFLVPGLARRSPMNLQTDVTTLFYAVVGFGVIGRLEAVDRKANALAFGADQVIVPVVALQDFVQFVEVRTGQYLPPPRLVVKRAPVLLPQVGLVTYHFVVVRDPFGTELDSGVGARRIAEQFEFQP